VGLSSSTSAAPPPAAVGATLFPEDLAPFARQPLLLITDSTHHHRFAVRGSLAYVSSMTAFCLLAPRAAPFASQHVW